MSIAVVISCAATFANTTSMASVNITGFVSDFEPFEASMYSRIAPNLTMFGNISTEKYFGLDVLPDVYDFGFAGKHESHIF